MATWLRPRNMAVILALPGAGGWRGKAVGEDFLGVLAMHGRMPADGGRRVGELERRAEHAHRADLRMRDRLDHAPRRRLLGLQRLGNAVDAPAGNADRLEAPDPVIGILAGERRLDQAVDELAVVDAVLVGGEARILSPYGMADNAGEAAELHVVADSDGDRRVLRPIDRIGHDIGMAVAVAAALDAADEIVRGDIGKHEERGFEQRDLDLLALAGG